MEILEKDTKFSAICSDPSELGLNLNNILCDICGNGSPVINNRCNDCKKYFSPDQQSRFVM